MFADVRGVGAIGQPRCVLAPGSLHGGEEGPAGEREGVREREVRESEREIVCTCVRERWGDSDIKRDRERKRVALPSARCKFLQSSELQNLAVTVSHVPMSSELGACKKFKARFWP